MLHTPPIKVSKINEMEIENARSYSLEELYNSVIIMSTQMTCLLCFYTDGDLLRLFFMRSAALIITSSVIGLSNGSSNNRCCCLTEASGGIN